MTPDSETPNDDFRNEHLNDGLNEDPNVDLNVDSTGEQRIAELIGSLRSSSQDDATGSADAASKLALRESLRLQSAQVFAGQSEAGQSEAGHSEAGQSEEAHAEASDAVESEVPTKQLLSPQSHRMFVLVSRFVAVAATIALLITGGFWLANLETSQATWLDKLAQAETAKLKLTVDGKTYTVFMRGWEELRFESGTAGVYQIARGPQLWEIDEAANRAATRPNPLLEDVDEKEDDPKGNQKDGRKINPFRLLGLAAVPSQEQLAKAEPVEQIEKAGKTLNVFQYEVADKNDKTVRFTAHVRADNSQLAELFAYRRTEGKWVPCGELVVAEVNLPLKEELFVVGNSLTEDGRIGKVLDSQGIVSVKPKMGRRFAPVTGSMLLRPGDWVRADARGANAVKFVLAKETTVTLGPGGLVELISPKQIVVQSGLVKVTATEDSPVELLGPNKQSIKVAGEALYRVNPQDGNRLVAIEKTPKWLAGFEGATADHSIGSLIVEVDGRNTPLHVGYHKVTVDIRDQIARTVIEQSFVNNTDSRLEGVFYFPLPQDASISGFGMWIGDELVEADIVEKQRAREIYETILREKRDPGLLEWTGGNIFKARVFPIFAHSEKRIKITYTQVLPREGNAYRYSYALQSEMLKQHPLRELLVDVRLSSVTPLKNVSSPTYSTSRTDQTTHSARVEFTAQEYTPERDFEVLVEVDERAPEVTLVPHRRGDDGYFMALIAPPAEPGERRRDVLPDGDPLELVILADTSASMDADTRRTQAEFIASVLAALTPEDKFSLGFCDVNCEFVSTEPQPATLENIEAARKVLDERISLGWTNLDAAFATALKQCGPDTQVIYVGDGIITTGNADPVEFAKRLKQLAADKAGGFHAVSVSSSFEPMVLKAIASLGGGSFRSVTGSSGPQQTAHQLLSELTSPALKDLKVEFEGIRTARVYPGELPNLPAGSQHIVLGRYLPEGVDQTGSVVVTGTRGGKPFRITTPVTLADAESGNSFIPRLWARMHLDALLEQGSSQEVQDDIIALSEEFHIITPYTSLLVLESDEDRERFGVKRRFNMRDGEKFFAEGRDNANYELLQKQMKLAGTWRNGLRRQILSQLMQLGRNVPMQHPHPIPTTKYLYNTEYFFETSGYTNGINLGGTLGGQYGGWGSRPGASTYGLDKEIRGDGTRHAGNDLYLGLPTEQPVTETATTPSPSQPLGEVWGNSLSDDVAFGNESLWAGDALQQEFATALGPGGPGFGLAVDPAEEGESYYFDLDQRREAGARYSRDRMSTYDVNGIPGLMLTDSRSIRRGQPIVVTNSQLIQGVFPALPASPTETPPSKSKWPAEARELAKNLLRSKQLASGLLVRNQTETFDPRWERVTLRSKTESLFSAERWYAYTSNESAAPMFYWCDKDQRGVIDGALLLGSVRKSTKQDLKFPQGDLPNFQQTSLEQTYQDYDIEIEKPGDDRAVLKLTHKDSPTMLVRVTIDTKRDVALELETLYDGKVNSRTTYSDFVEVNGEHWPRKVERFNANGKLNIRMSYAWETIDAAQAAAALKEQLAGYADVLLLETPAPTVPAAKRAIAKGDGSFADYLILTAHFMQSQQWDRAWENFELATAAAPPEQSPEKPGLKWIRYQLLYLSRRHEQLKQELFEEAKSLAEKEPENSPYAGEYALGERIVNLGSVLQSNEMLSLIDELRTMYNRLPESIEPMKLWKTWKVNYVNSVGDVETTLRLRKELAEQFPRDYSLPQQYAYGLFNAGEVEAALAYLESVIKPERKWLPYEEDSLRGTYVQLLRNHGRYEEMLEYLSAWVALEPESSTAYAQYLSVLVRTDQEEKANELVSKWLKLAQQAKDKEISAAESAKLQAAIDLALGQGYNLRTNRIEERWLKPLAEVVWTLALSETQSSLAERIMNQYYFQITDACRGVRKQAVAKLQSDLAKLDYDDANRLINWITPNDPEVKLATWKEIVAGLQKRWETSKDDSIKHQWAELTTRVLGEKIGTAEQMAFVRKKIEAGPKQFRAAYRNQLFDLLLAQLWTQENEDEAFSLLSQLSDSKDKQIQDVVAISALQRLTDQMINARYQSLMLVVKDQEKLTRTELRDKQKENLKKAQKGYLKRLEKELNSVDAEEDALLRDWMKAEWIYVSVRIGEDLHKVAEECWELLGTDPPPPLQPDEDGFIEITGDQRLEMVLHYRLLVTLANLAARKDADEKQVQRLLKYLDAGIQADPENLSWKMRKYQLLIALDQPEPLEKAIRQWIQADKPLSFWRVTLGKLLAEQGKVEPAVELLEQVEAADELLPADYRTLASWYLVLDQKEKYHAAQVETYMTMPEWQMQQWLQQQLSPWQQSEGTMPEELDERVFIVFEALFKTSTSPGNYIYLLQNFYRETKDFRLLSGLADSMRGHTAMKVYSVLQNLSTVLGEVREEATVDDVVERIHELRDKSQTPIDLRALDLLEAAFERRAAELINEPGPHGKNALAAFKRAFDHAWSDGEEPLMAQYLADMGRIGYEPLATEQRRQLKELHSRAKPGTKTRLDIAVCVARTEWAYDARNDAIDLLTAGLDEYREAHDGVLPIDAQSPIEYLISYYEAEEHFAEAEKFLLAELDRSVNSQQTDWLTLKLYRVYYNALYHDALVSLGKEQTLYEKVEEKLRAEIVRLKKGNPSQQYQLIDTLCDIYRRAKDKEFTGVAADLKDFAFKQLPDILVPAANYYDNNVGQVAEAIHYVSGPLLGLEFLIVQIENEPKWLRLNSRDGWSSHGGRIAWWRHEAKDIGDLAPRLLAIVVNEMREEFRTQQSRNRNIYWINNSYFWTEKKADFMRVANEYYAEHKDSNSDIKYLANYFYHGLDEYDRAIEILLDAHRREILDDDGKWTLVDYLHRQSRYGESIAILVPMIEKAPDNLTYRVYLMSAYFHTKQQEQLIALLDATDKYFHEGDRWQENVISQLAYSTLENELYERSAKYFEEVIALHQRTQPNRGIGSGTLSSYYRNLAEAYINLKNTVKAVDAASGAVVSWEPRNDNREHALNQLVSVLNRSNDLAGYIAHLDKETKESGLDNPIVRKALGQAWMDHEEYAKAITQLELAVELQPHDSQTHKLLIECYDKQEEPQKAVEQLLASAQLLRRDLSLYKDLGSRMTKLEQPNQAERAYTAIVEMQPNESESHTMLAEIRQSQDRWGDAIEHWQRVAELRELEPTGLVSLAKAQIHEGRLEAAEETIKQLRSRTWPSRFSNVDSEIYSLESKLRSKANPK